MTNEKREPQEPKTHKVTLNLQPANTDPVGTDFISDNPSFGSTVRVSQKDTLEFEADEDFCLAFPSSIRLFEGNEPFTWGGYQYQGQGSGNGQFKRSLTVKPKDEISVNRPYYYYVSMASQVGGIDSRKRMVNNDKKLVNAAGVCVDAQGKETDNPVDGEEPFEWEYEVWIQDPDTWVDDC